MPGAGGGTKTFHFSTNGGGPSGFSFSNPQSIFDEFVRSGGGGVGGDEDDDLGNIFSAFGGAGARPGGGSRRMRTGFNDSGRSARQPAPEVTTVERPLPVSLEDMFNGANKKMKIKRKVFDETGKRTLTDQVLDVPIKPGLKKGSKIRFKGVGDQEEGGQQDLCFVVEEVCFPNFPTCFPPISFFLFLATGLLTKCRNHMPSTPGTATTLP